jgi:hypothetical protein
MRQRLLRKTSLPIDSEKNPSAICFATDCARDSNPQASNAFAVGRPGSSAAESLAIQFRCAPVLPITVHWYTIRFDFRKSRTTRLLKHRFQNRSPFQNSNHLVPMGLEQKRTNSKSGKMAQSSSDALRRNLDNHRVACDFDNAKRSSFVFLERASQMPRKSKAASYEFVCRCERRGRRFDRPSMQNSRKLQFFDRHRQPSRQLAETTNSAGANRCPG